MFFGLNIILYKNLHDIGVIQQIQILNYLQHVWCTISDKSFYHNVCLVKSVYGEMDIYRCLKIET